MTIIVTGGDGYIGWPTGLEIASSTDERVVLVDNLARREWVSEVGATSVTPAVEPSRRVSVAREQLHLSKLSFVQGDLRDRSFVDDLLAVHEPTTIVHAAAQPSAPYSQLNGERANYTQHNNMQATRNLLWGLEEAGQTDTHFIETTTTGVYGAPDFTIPEGGAEMVVDGERDDVPFPAMAGSWYHTSKAHDAANLRLAHDQFGIPISDVRTAIVCGVETGLTASSKWVWTRLDFDYYFGTVAHRFCAQAIAGHPLTVYGAGEQRKPFISLSDAVRGLARLATHPPDDGLTVYNQVARAIPIVKLAERIAEEASGFVGDVDVVHVENPRDEDETHRMEIENDRYMDVIGTAGSLREPIHDVLEVMDEHAHTIQTHEDRFLPAALQED